jgi:hypothetical protein
VIRSVKEETVNGDAERGGGRGEADGDLRGRVEALEGENAYLKDQLKIVGSQVEALERSVTHRCLHFDCTWHDNECLYLGGNISLRRGHGASVRDVADG